MLKITTKTRYEKLAEIGLPVVVVVALLAATALVWATASLTVTPDTGLTNNETVTVTGTGLEDSTLGALLECNSDPNQPTVEFAGSPVPVSCSPAKIYNTTKAGKLSEPFTVIDGTSGPPTTGTDSSGGSASADAANYPCPPTQAQINAGDSCFILYGEEDGSSVQENITFANQPSPTQTPPPSPSPTPSSSPTSSSGSTSSSSKSTTSSTKSSQSSAASTGSSSSSSSTEPESAGSSENSTGTVTVAVTASLSVTVDSSKDQPIADAKVTLDNKTTLFTDKNGIATFKGVSSGDHTVAVSAAGKSSKQTKITLNGGETKLVDVSLSSNKSPAPYVILAVLSFVVLAGACAAAWWYFRRRGSDDGFAASVSNSVVSGGVMNSTAEIKPEKTVETVTQPAPSPVVAPQVIKPVVPPTSSPKTAPLPTSQQPQVIKPVNDKPVVSPGGPGDKTNQI